ncbi:(2Fe-2S) ferredoxin domain-containing protein [Sphingomonas naphthae]|uniref:(2Fe-2S) ferredoxin domain-containing protein n=1 Tax=Sphingomonas naphthae TaxID=1813468 RepID=A0ABY7TNZ1_9SPHN|nr:(2Fe-2S) ferredoxin domain-containing protein [Sphingomonas naphthae]WCT74957.1 (2Fe-2S) ferredoxin domain-containing protein [Sphingomonas naphthae]
MKAAKANWSRVLLVCAKCEKKLGNAGFGADGDERLSRVLKRQAGGKGRKARFGVVPVKCLKLCPRRAVTVVDSAQPGRWLVVAPGEAIDGLIGEASA